MSRIKIILIAILVAALVILPVSAEDSNSTDIAVAQDMADDLQVTQEKELSSTHSVVGNTFEDIQNAVDNAKEGDTIELSGNYTGNGREIIIDKSLNIQGIGNAVLDAKANSSIFSIFADKDTRIMNLSICNGINSAIHSSKIHSFVCLNCIFVNNTGTYGGAISLGDAVKCEFVNNSADYGGAMYECNAINCTFTYNYAIRGGATYDADAKDCLFIYNYAIYQGGAMMLGDAVNCSFINNVASSNGGAMCYGDALTCKFINNTDEEYLFFGLYPNGDAIYWGDAIYCYFEGNPKSSQSVSKVYCHAELNVSQSGQYYPNKVLTIRLWDIDSNLPLDKESVEIKFSNGLSDKITTDSDGVANYQIPLRAGTYSATVSPESPCITVEDAVLDNIVVEKAPANLDIQVIGEDYGDVELALTFTDSILNNSISDEEVEIRFSNGKSVRLTTDSEGIAVYSVPFESGIYNVTASVVSDNFIVDDAVLNNVTINMVSAELEVSGSGNDYGDVNLILTLSRPVSNEPISGERIQVKFSNGNYIYLNTDSDGVASYSIPFAPGSYSLTASLISKGFDAQSKSISFIIEKITPELTASKKTFKVKAKTKKYTITLSDDNEKPIKNAKVTLKIKGKTYKATTNAKGKATFKITKLNKKGSFKATVNFSGNGYYHPVSKKIRITVKK